MFYELKVKDHIRVPPELFKEEDIKGIILKSLNEKYDSFISKSLGIVIGVSNVLDVGEGIIIPGDGAAYYDTEFNLIVFKPEIQEIVLGSISDITDFGVFFNIGPIDGMIHISQTMDDFVTFSKTGVLVGKESKKVLKQNDKCRARVIAVSFKEINNPKIGLTMRQPALGALQWLVDEKKKVKSEEKKIKIEKKKEKK